MYERYYHDVVGVNSRLDSIQAAVLRVKLPKLNSYNKARQEAARKYTKALQDCKHIETPQVVNNQDCTKDLGICDTCDCHVFHQYSLRITNGTRDALAKHLAELQIPHGIYYPIPLHSQKAYKDTRYNEADFPVTNELVKEVLALPMHTELTDDQIDLITTTIIDFLKD